MDRGSRLLCWVLIAVLLAGGVVIVLSGESRGVGSAEYTVEVVGPNPSPVRRAAWEWCPTRESAESMVGQSAEVILTGGHRAKEVSDRSFVMSQLTTTRDSPFRHTFTYRRWAVVAVELADGTQRVLVLEFPDPRTDERAVVFEIKDD
jgi:hypothetical protein